MNILYERYSAALYGVISRIINDDHLAEDVLQESFVKIWKNVDEYDLNRGRLFTWMLNICRNTAIDKMRSKGYKTAMKTQSDETVLYENPTKIYDSVKPETIGIREIVTKLKPEWRTIIDLIYFNGYTHQEAAETLNLPLGTVKTRLRSAIMYLRESI
jgi:RNA polymerase sigma-70 factor (ECF subfamily)